jgi:hypothetical protein
MCQLVRTLPASHPVLVHRLASLLHASFRPYLAARPLRFAITSPPSGCEEDLHLPAVEHARHTQKNGRHDRRPFSIHLLAIAYFFMLDWWLATHFHFPPPIFTHVSVNRSTWSNDSPLGSLPLALKTPVAIAAFPETVTFKSS